MQIYLYFLYIYIFCIFSYIYIYIYILVWFKIVFSPIVFIHPLEGLICACVFWSRCVKMGSTIRQNQTSIDPKSVVIWSQCSLGTILCRGFRQETYTCKRPTRVRVYIHNTHNLQSLQNIPNLQNMNYVIYIYITK